MNVDQSYRVFAFASFLGILFVCYEIALRLKIDIKVYLVFASLLCLLYYLRVLKSRKLLDLGLATVFGSLAALKKVTTFPAIVFVGFIATLVHYLAILKTHIKSP